MAKYTGAVCRICRREGKKMFLKGEKCYNKEKCPFESRSYAPGQHGQARARKMSGYGKQLRAKQVVRRYYGVLEGQFYHYYELATKMNGVTGENLLALLETRLDNVAYRLGYGRSRTEARQMVTHGHILVNGKRVNIPSFLVKPGMTISLSEKARGLEKMKTIIEANSAHPVPQWLDLNRDTTEAKVLSMPARSDIDLDVEETLIVELYSK